jgi:TonB-dependent receptor
MGTLCAQNSISGQVLDAETGEPLIGAAVGILGTSKGTATDERGRFNLKNIEEEQVTVFISYTGFKEQQLEVNTTSGNPLEIRLSSDAVQLQEVVVSGIMDGQLEAITEMRDAANIKNVISAEQIITFPDLNAAEVMQRIPGITLQRDQGEGRFVQLRGTPPELTNFNINGEQVPSPEGGARYIGLDIIPSDQIESVEVTKVITPDMDADGIGGSVDIKTREAQEGPPQIIATLAGGYNNMRQKPIYNAQFAYGQRFNKLGFQLNASFFENNQGSDNIEYKYTKGPFFNNEDQEEGQDNFFLHWREVQLRHYEITRTRIAVSPTLDYRFNDRNYLYLKGMYNSFTDEETRRRKIYDLDDPFSATLYLFGGIDHDVRKRTKQQELATVALGGEHDLGFMQIDYQLFYANAGERQPDRLEARFDSPGQAITISWDVSDPDYPRAEFPNENNAGNATDYENFEFDELLFEDYNTQEDLWTPRINLTFPYEMGGSGGGYFKFGGKLRARVKERDVRSLTFSNYRETSRTYPGTGDPLNLITIGDGFRDDNLLKQNYLVDFTPGVQEIRDFYEFWPQFFIISRNSSRKNSYEGDYRYRENIYAAYGMVEHNIGRLMVLAGLRYERTDVLENRAFGVRLDGPRFVGIDTFNTTRVIDFLLPQIQLRYRLNNGMNLRGAFSYSYARPNYSEVIPTRQEDRREISIGNPNLEYPLSMNVDLMFERYFNRSILSAGLFYKQIDNFVFNYKRFGREGEPGTGNFPVFEFTKPLNGRDAQVFGAEFQAQFKFDFFTGFFSDFGFFANYTYTYSRAFIPERVPANYADAVILDPQQDDLSEFFADENQEEISLPGQAQHTANLALFYDGPKFFARLSANYQDAFLTEIGADPDLDEFYDEALRLDYTMNYQFTQGVNVFFDWINITDTPLRLYLGEPNTIAQLEYYSWWMRAGVRLRL